MMIMVLLFAGMGVVNAQQQQKAKGPMTLYIQENVVPTVKKEQAKFIKALSDKERQQLEQMKGELKAFHIQGKEIRKSMKGHFNQELWKNHKKSLDAIKANAEKLVANHPKAAAAYEAAIQTARAQWMKDMQALRHKRMQAADGMKRMHPNVGNQHPLFARLGDPAFGLLMDANHFHMKDMWMRGSQHHPGEMNRQCKAKSEMRGHQGMHGRQGMRGQIMMNRRPAMSPVIREKVMAYAKKNIFPVISKERMAFDTKLSNNEKRQIEKARKEIKAHADLMKEYHNKPKHASAERMNDSTRLALRIEHQKNMLPIEEIALKHYGEIQNYINKIKGQSQQWRDDIRSLVIPDNQRPPVMQRRAGAKNEFMKNKTVRFLLFDPANPQLPFMK